MRLINTISDFLTKLIAPLLPAKAATSHTGSAYDYSFHTLTGNQPLPLSNYKGQVIMIVNTASRCAFTPQYAALEALYNKYKDRGFVLIGVPSNDFGHQEPGSSEEIEKFCAVNFNVTFPMTAKEVVRGDKVHPFFNWARNQLGFGSGPKWNFQKYLIDRNGNIVEYFYSITKPDSNKMAAAIEKLL